MALVDAASDLGQHGVGTAAARRAADERDHAEVAGERAAVLDLHERAHAVDPRVGLNAADRPDVACDERRGVLAPSCDHGDIRGQAGEGAAIEVRAAAGQIDAAVRPRRARRSLAALRDGLVRDAAGADHRDIGGLGPAFGVAVAEERLTHLVHVGMRDLAAEEVDAERRHEADRMLLRRCARS